MLRSLVHGPRDIIGTLSYLRTKALRKGVWFRTLSNQERILTGLIRKHIKIVKNTMLATVIARIMGKLISAINTSFMDMIEKIGLPSAELWARAACAMGWKEASAWVNDPNIVRWFGLTTYYSDIRMGSGVGVAA